MHFKVCVCSLECMYKSRLHVCMIYTFLHKRTHTHDHMKIRRESVCSDKAQCVYNVHAGHSYYTTSQTWRVACRIKRFVCLACILRTCMLKSWCLKAQILPKKVLTLLLDFRPFFAQKKGKSSLMVLCTGDMQTACMHDCRSEVFCAWTLLCEGRLFADIHTVTYSNTSAPRAGSEAGY